MLKSRLILLIIPLFFSCSESIKTTQKPLNVVWISCEDMGPILGSYGNDVVKTPNLDKLASCLLYTSPSPRDATLSRMPSSA